MFQENTTSVTIQQLLKVTVERGASDLHITTHSAPQLRIDGSLIPLNVPPLTAIETKQLCYGILNDKQKITFEKHSEVDLSFGVKGLGRFRANIFMQRGAVAGCFRTIPFKIRTLAELNLPSAIGDLSKLPRGLVLVTGPTGSGKSTTLAAIIDRINSETRQHIVTIEDPIEYVHPHKSCVVNQREIGVDTATFKDALKYVLRQDPDVVLIGEMRDLQTIEAALTVAETGHLVFGTLHTNNAVQSIHRIIDVFPTHQQAQVRAQLSMALQAVVSQLLIPRANGPGRVAAHEILILNPAVRNMIREDKVHQVYSAMQTGQNQSGMQTMNQSLYALTKKNLIKTEEAFAHSDDATELQNLFRSNAPF